MLASKIASSIDGILIGPGDPEIKTIAPINEAQEADIAFLHNDKYAPFLGNCKAGCVVVREDLVPKEHDYAIIVSENPHLCMGIVIDLLYPKPELQYGIHPQAIVDRSATIGKNVNIGPLAFIGPECIIGDGSKIESGSKLMGKIHIGQNCEIFPNVTIYPNSWIGENCVIHAGTIIGSDGFGFAPTEDGIIKIRQVGKTIIERDVEIGACCTIDRGSLTETRICRGTKMDNMIHIGHNCRIGEYCLIAAQSGFAGSTIVGDKVIIAGQVGFGGHQKIGDGSIIFAKSGVNGNVEPGSVLFGYPAKDRMKAHREQVYVSKLNELFKDVKRLKKLLEDN